MSDSARKLEELPGLVKTLYSSAHDILRLEIWNHADESVIFGFENYRPKEVFFIHIMGALGEYRAVSFYRGARGLQFLLSMYSSPPESRTPFDIYLACDKLELSFDEESYLMPRDHELIRISGVSLPAGGLLPVFRRYQPGYYPWFIEPEEAEYMNLVLTLLPALIARMETGAYRIASPLEEDRVTIFRLSPKAGNKMDVVSSDEPIPDLEPEALRRPPVDELRLKKLNKGKEHREAHWSMGGSFFSDEPLQDAEDSAPFYPFAVLCVDSGTGRVLHHDLSPPDRIPGTVIDVFLRAVEAAGFIPSCIEVPDEDFLELLGPLRDKLKFSCKVKQKLPFLEEALGALRSFTEGSSASGNARGKPSRKKKKR